MSECKVAHELYCTLYGFLNQVHAGLWPVCAWFLKIVFVGMSLCVCVYVCMCMCVLPRLLITSGVIWTPHVWFNKFCSCYMAIVFSIINGRSLGIDMHRGN